MPFQPPPLSTQLQSQDINMDIPMTYLHLHAGADKPLLLLFHGYEDTAAGVLRRSLGDPDDRYEILAINGPFPVPVKIENGWKQTFAWYFADYSKKQVLIPPTIAATAVGKIVQNLNLGDRPKAMIGFSQGGFFLPFVLPHLKNVKKVFAMGAGYRPEDYPRDFSLSVDAFHGTEDQVIPLQFANESFRNLARINPKGEFFTFEGLGHTMSDESRLVLRKRIDEAFL